jgi:hypothetical protein
MSVDQFQRDRAHLANDLAKASAEVATKLDPSGHCSEG